MKKLIAILLIVILALSLFACGAQSNGQNAPAADASEETLSADKIAAIRSAYDKASAFVDANFNTKNMEVSEQDDKSEAYLYKILNCTDGTVNADFTNDVEVDGITITIGKTTVKELKGLDGYELDLPEDTVKPNSILGFSLSKGDKTCMLSTAANDTDKAAPVDDLTIDQIACAYSDFSLPFIYSGLDEKSTVKDIIEKVGEPNSSIQISADDQGAAIDLNYTRTGKAEGLSVNDTLSLSLRYNAGDDTAAVSGVRLNRSIIQ